MRREPHVRFCERAAVKFHRATHLVVGFEHEADARRFWDEMRERLEEFALSLHPEKTRLIEFGRFAAADARGGAWKTGDLQVPRLHLHLRKNAQGQIPGTRKTRRDRMRTKLPEIKEEMRRRMHRPIPEQGRWLGQVVSGFFNYHAVPTNSAALGAFHHSHRLLAAHASAAQPEGPHHMGADEELGRRLAS